MIETINDRIENESKNSPLHSASQSLIFGLKHKFNGRSRVVAYENEGEKQQNPKFAYYTFKDRDLTMGQNSLELHERLSQERLKII